MAFVLWTVLLSTLLWAQTSEAVDETQLAELVTNLLEAYKPTSPLPNVPTFTIAASIPFNVATGRYDLSQVTAVDASEDVKRNLSNCDMYVGNRVIGAMVLKWKMAEKQCPDGIIPENWSFVKALCPNVNTWGELNRVCKSSMTRAIQSKSPNSAVDHAEYRVLQSFDPLVNKLNNGQLNQNDLMLFYSYKAPCDARCASLTNSFSILQSISAINKWPKRVLVFSDIFVPSSNRPTIEPSTVTANRRTALANLGNVINVGNIFRCPTGSSHCTCCAALAGIADACLNDDTHSTLIGR